MKELFTGLASGVGYVVVWYTLVIGGFAGAIYLNQRKSKKESD